MDRRVTFIIPGAPFAKQRARSGFNKRLGRAITFNAPANEKFEGTVGSIAAGLFSAPLDGPVSVTVEAVFCPAPSWSKKRRAEAMGQPHTQKPDGDNLLKAIKDGLNRIAWSDDAQVSDSRVMKRWGERAETRVTVERIMQ
ncbi:Holliday junction resolvase [Haematobacter missouriensis]|uniref:RusA family crossover junction endodeoxyribonuclease n=1 Tax=Haematobacter missouriensis TaxID=366616 RepID=A0A212AQL5_9RHOB|nr:RusA family crossover junction endodeoxyribonuclease [Haematobacter missouriensis]KFI30974.1 Holliday junction resolvase [Haematobacter missouriensis]OWJ73902.1 RusA family crossover junction endodeoxyribonuclease [Haematobacter missouriensis]OWJ83801.1 RusA family crossover junction endodeoxyribonuclease [Haematobacter missouriensis]